MDFDGWLHTLALLLCAVLCCDALDIFCFLQGVENYNNTDGSTSVQINDALPFSKGKKAGTPTTTTTSSNPAIQAEKGAKTPSAASSNASLVPGLFAAAEAGNWTLEQWIAASSTGYDVRKWRLLITWPFGEESSVYRFNARGDGLYATTSLGRCVAPWARKWGEEERAGCCS